MKPLHIPSPSAILWPVVAVASLFFALYGGWGVYQALTANTAIDQGDAIKAKALPSLVVNTEHTRFGAIATATPSNTGPVRIDPFVTQ